VAADPPLLTQGKVVGTNQKTAQMLSTNQDTASFGSKFNGCQSAQTSVEVGAPI